MRIVQTPFRAPNANAYAERFVRSIKDECLNRVIPFGERHLRRTLAEFIEHYHGERNHQGLGNELIDRASQFGTLSGVFLKSPDKCGGRDALAAAWLLFAAPSPPFSL